MVQSKFPKGWDENRVKRVLEHYDTLKEDEAVAEDESAWENPSQTFMEIPNDLVPTIRELLARRGESRKSLTESETSGT
ncbi:MAG: hypothetical protein U5R49_09210 [Deltaproteobacteria bacterium]|nr:hypothetical protein [Deltaproteobacteria bacterium]